MKYYEVVPVGSARYSPESLTYHSETSLKFGEIVSAAVRSKINLAVVIRDVAKPDFKTKEIDSSLKIVLAKPLMELAKWIHKYYQAPLGACLRLLIPTGIGVKRRVVSDSPSDGSKNNTSFEFSQLTKDQLRALEKIKDNHDTSLLFGVTGSGKTRIYLELAKRTIDQEKSVIVLVPEISLTTQLEKAFLDNFESVLVTHSNMTSSERHKVWEKINSSKKPLVVIGPRSALFSPIANLGLVIIDECHDDSYKQTNTPRYDSLKVARILCNLQGAKLVLGSATPLIADYYVASKLDALVEISQPINEKSGRQVEVIDMRKESQNIVFSKKVIEKITEALRGGHQILVYHNRRGTAPIIVCNKCSWSAVCHFCHIRLVLHQDSHDLKCHSCGRASKVPTSCPDCGNSEIIYRGFGTKKIALELNKLFPEAIVARFDADNKKDDSMAEMYHMVRNGEVDIIVGTQMIAKGLDLPKLNTGVIVMADTGLGIPDYRTNELVFQLIHQVIGRVGRHSKISYVGVQTLSPDNPLVKMAVAQDYQSFYESGIDQRKLASYPPFKHLLLLTASYSSRDLAKNAATKVLSELASKHKSVDFFGPTPSYYERLGKKYRWQILVKSSSRARLVDVAREVETKSNWQANLDPLSLL